MTPNSKKAVCIAIAAFFCMVFLLNIEEIKKTPPASQKINVEVSQGTIPVEPTERPKSQKRFVPVIREGGKELENSAAANASRQLRGQGPITSGTVIHEATHLLNSQLNQQIGGSTQLQPSNGFCAFYLWGEDKYLIFPTAGFKKILVAGLIPMDTIGDSHRVYFSSDYASRDAIHLIEDFDAELNGFEPESPQLLRDMLIYSVALGYAMQQRNHRYIKQYQAGDKLLIERSVKKSIDLTAFRSSSNPKAIILREYLVDVYGETWTKKYLGF